MKKWIGFLVLLLVIFIASVFIFIPNIISVDRHFSVAVNHSGLYRNLSESARWKEWWPDTSSGKTSDSAYSYHGFNFKLRNQQTFSLVISITRPQQEIMSSLNFVSTVKDSVTLDWEAKMTSSYNPIKRLNRYLEARKLATTMDELVEAMTNFYSVTANMYGFDIQKKTVVDSTLLSTFASSKGYPSNEFIYDLIGQLKTYIKEQGAKETGFPMLNIFTHDSLNYMTKVAIPVDTKLKPSGNMAYRWMLPGGNMLITEVKGGPVRIAQAYQQIETYISDFQRVAPAIPFLSLVTDRIQIPDTSKWVTRIYYPVM